MEKQLGVGTKGEKRVQFTVMGPAVKINGLIPQCLTPVLSLGEIKYEQATKVCREKLMSGIRKRKFGLIRTFFFLWKKDVDLLKILSS